MERKGKVEGTLKGNGRGEQSWREVWSEAEGERLLEGERWSRQFRKEQEETSQKGTKLS